MSRTNKVQDLYLEQNGTATEPGKDIELQTQELPVSEESGAHDSQPHSKQHSIVTILSLWNGMMGTSLLSMPWAIKQAGFTTGIVLLIAMAGLMAYTSYRVMSSTKHLAGKLTNEFSDVVRIYLGKFAEAVTLLSSVIVFLGAAIVFWILMSNYLYNIVVFIFRAIHDDTSNQTSSGNYENVVCHNHSGATVDLPDSFEAAWDETNTIPLFLVILLFPLINIKSPTFFTKFSALGTLSSLYLMVFVSVKASRWGFHVDFEDSTSDSYVENFKLSFPATTGVAFLAYFLHNAIIIIMRNQKHPEHNTRDLIIAYALVCLTYTFMGSVFYAAFPLDKSCVADNLFDNFTSTDKMSFIARIGLFFQIVSILPLVIYVIRNQLLQCLFGSIWPSLKHVVVLNAVVVTTCVLFAVFFPKIGRIISFVGSFCGLSYAIALPCLVYLVSSHQKGTLTRLKIAFHCMLIVFGVLNFIAQFIVVGLL